MVNNTRTTTLIKFLEEINQLKQVYRANYISEIGRNESDAEHVWHMCLFAMLFSQELKLDLNLPHVLEIILAHDLVEVYAGDAYAHDPKARRASQEKEHLAADKLFALLPKDLESKFHSLWDEFELKSTKEAQFANAMDKLQPFALNVQTKGRLWTEKGVTEEKSRRYNQQCMDFFPELKVVFENLYQRAKSEKLWPPK